MPGSWPGLRTAQFLGLVQIDDHLAAYHLAGKVGAVLVLVERYHAVPRHGDGWELVESESRLFSSTTIIFKASGPHALAAERELRL